MSAVARTTAGAGTDLLIVGAGLVGAAMALSLASGEAGERLRITLVEPVVFRPSYSESRFDSRVVALTEKSRTLLERLGVWEAIQDRCCAFANMHVEDADGTGSISFTASEVGQPWLGHIAENSLIVEHLLERLGRHENVKIICPGKVVALQQAGDQGCAVELDNGDSIVAGLVVAADGANSLVRHMAGFDVREWLYGQDAIVATIQAELPHKMTARQWFTTEGPLAFLPLAGTPDPALRSCSIVWSQQTSEAERLMSLSDEAFCRELTMTSKAALGAVTGCSKRFCFPLRQRHAIRYCKPGIVLIGDAAHSIHPLAGQGVNLGFQDVLALQESIEWGMNVGLMPGQSRVLQRFQRLRKPDNLRMMLLMEGFKLLFGSKLLPVRVIRNLGLSQANRMSPVKNRLIREAMGIS